MTINTILFLTDNSLSDDLFYLCRRRLLQEAVGLPIVSVSQKPLDLGKNVCVGEIGRSWMSLYKQILAGLAVVETDNVVVAEHDCLYSAEHLNYTPEDKDAFYYNHNHWLVQWGGNHPELNGMYSHLSHRTALSQLICTASLLRESTEEVMRLLDMGLKVDRGLHWYGEPGVVSDQFRTAFVKATCGRSPQLQKYLKDYVTKYKTEFFSTEIPNLDIRHGTNFSGAKRGKKRCYALPYWGRFEDVVNG